MHRNRLGDGLDVVVRKDDGVGGHTRRDTGRRGDPERGEPGPRTREEGVGVAVVAAGELDHAVAAGERPGQPDRRHRRLGARRDEAHELDRREGVGDLLGQLDLALGGGAERRPCAGRVAHRVDRLGIGVPEEQWPPRLDPVEQAAAVGGLEIRALAACREERLVQADAPHRAHRRVDTAGNDLPRAVPERGANEAQSAATHCANSFAQYVITMSAPALRIDVSDSTAEARSSRSPAAAAAFSIAYSPDTL